MDTEKTKEPIEVPKETPEALFERKREEARAAMEGPEWTEKRERSEREKQTLSERETLEHLTADITKQKDKLELDWIALDDQRKIIRETLAPILEREKVAEEEEARLELEEAKTGLPRPKQEIEKNRWAAQDKRRSAEQEKWGLQEKLFKLEQAIEVNTQKYRALLDQEDTAQTKLNAIQAQSGNA